MRRATYKGPEMRGNMNRGFGGARGAGEVTGPNEADGTCRRK